MGIFMDDQVQWLVLGALFIAAAIWVAIRNASLNERRIKAKIRNDWGRLQASGVTDEELGSISRYHGMKLAQGGYEVDDITWNDLSMDDIYRCINNTYSSVGREYLYHMLRSPQTDTADYDELEHVVSIFGRDAGSREAVQREFYRLGTTKRVPVCDYIDLIGGFDDGGCLGHVMCIVAIAVSILVAVLFSPILGIVLLVASIGVTVISYYKCKARVEPYYVCVGHIARMAACGKSIAKLNVSGMEEITDHLKGLSKGFEGVTRKIWVLGATGGLDGSLAEVVMDYVRILTHVDLICFHFMLREIRGSIDRAWELMEVLGRLESELAIASFRQGLSENGCCVPRLCGETRIVMADGYHPLIKRPVKNSFNEDRSVLLTGSNASGKSTFLKTLAVNQILAQSIHTCAAGEFQSGMFRVYSSMALRDDVVSGDSYYMVEIKSIKRIMDAVGEAEKPPVLCFVDEVLRGTNTVERIAASSRILEKISRGNALCMAATHDIELTGILEGCYANYHFQESVTDDDVRFDYLLRQGKATSRNAIRLLGLLGFDRDVVESAEKLAARLENDNTAKLE
jgi:hypothetical protein